MSSSQPNTLRTALTGLQMLFVAFGALVLMPLLSGIDPNLALFTAGIGTLIFQFVTKFSVPIFLASSFVFISPISQSVETWGMAATMGALLVTGLMYVCLALLVSIKGPGIIERVMPPVVTGPIVIVIGLTLAPIAVNMAMGKTGNGAMQLFDYKSAMIVSMTSLAATILVATLAKGIFKLVPILSGIVVGFALSYFMGIVDLSKVSEASLIAIPTFITPEFNLAAILFMIPVAIAPTIEHVGDIVAISSVTGKQYLKEPGLHRTLLGDGLATSAAALMGGPPNTTYSEVTGAVTLTKAFNPIIMVWAAIFAIAIAFVGKFGIFLQSIPTPVMGGILILLFGSIASVGINIMVKNNVDLTNQRNIAIVSSTLVIGIGGMVVGNEHGFYMKGVSVCGIMAVLLNLILPDNQKEEA